MTVLSPLYKLTHILLLQFLVPVLFMIFTLLSLHGSHFHSCLSIPTPTLTGFFINYKLFTAGGILESFSGLTLLVGLQEWHLHGKIPKIPLLHNSA